MATETGTNNTPALEFRHVSFSFDEKRVLSDISFKLERGEMLFITGESGSGKSVLLRLAIALDHPDSGQVLIERSDVSEWDEEALLKLRGSRMGIVFQEDTLFTGLSVYENVAYRLQEHHFDEGEIAKQVMEVLRFVGLEADVDKLPAQLSGGMRRRLEIARALVGWPAIMLFDEPASGLDPLTAIQVLDLIVRARDVYGISSIYVTKKLDEIPYLATHRARQRKGGIVVEEATGPEAPNTRVIVLAGGRIVFSGSVDEFELSSSPAVTHLTRAEWEPEGTEVAPINLYDKSTPQRQQIL